MKGKTGSTLLVLLVACIACFVSVPVVSSEHPWDTDKPPGGGHIIFPPPPGADTVVIVKDSTTQIGSGSPRQESSFVMRSIFRVTYQISRFYGGKKRLSSSWVGFRD
ncbi:MAG: hypothetical protein SGI97_05990 [candidate division Zixibacteria bacterium]|nr:hypothetical protein [candidate division Zixibacteria bacterium]